MGFFSTNGDDNRNTLLNIKNVLICNAMRRNFASFAISVKVKDSDCVECFEQMGAQATKRIAFEITMTCNETYCPKTRGTYDLFG